MFAPKTFTASGQISASPCIIGGVIVQAAAGGSCTINIANKASGGGDSVLPWVQAASTTDGPNLPAGGVALTTAGYITITGTTPTLVTVFWKPIPGSF